MYLIAWSGPANFEDLITCSGPTNFWDNFDSLQDSYHERVHLCYWLIDRGLSLTVLWILEKTLIWHLKVITYMVDRSVWSTWHFIWESFLDSESDEVRGLSHTLTNNAIYICSNLEQSVFPSFYYFTFDREQAFQDFFFFLFALSSMPF